ncbi:hypothetical protein QR680_013995 [Steinernema hermaphroditum]|uniref:UBX domain-containing protein n=1 Tax=Steinernema hermaphroditum TaxID=289476 RepID=A0AA39I9F7_9BILA|nr:hypothetical protein QR680_013995 [Steinernema hermaphroditum]
MPPKRRVEEEDDDVVVLDDSDDSDDSVVALDDDAEDDDYMPSDEGEDGDVDFDDADDEPEEAEVVELSDDEDMEVEALDDRLPLMFDGEESLAEKLDNFAMIFESRYGETHPLFYPGPLQDAKLQSLSHPTFEERRPLAIYVHRDDSPNADNFAKEILCSPPITEFLGANYITFGWDTTQQANAKILFDALRDEGLDYVSMAIQRARKSDFPLIALVNRTKTITFKLAALVYGNDTLDSVLSKLEITVREMRSFMSSEAEAHRERQARENLRQLQQAEYEASLKADQEERRAKEEAQAKLEAEEAEEKRQAAAKEKRVVEQEAALPDEPPASEANIVTLKFNFPGEPPAIRRFRKTDTVRMVTVFAESKGFLMDDYDVFNSDRPMKNVAKEYDLDKTFGEVNWPTRECLNVGLR